MTDHDSGRTKGGASRRVTPARRRASDTPRPASGSGSRLAQRPRSVGARDEGIHHHAGNEQDSPSATDPRRNRIGGAQGADSRPRPPRDVSRVAASRDVQISPGAGESKYPGASSADPLSEPPADDRSTRFNVEDGEVFVTVDSDLSDAAADVLWRVIEKAIKRGTAT
jgi:hypothetical protein